MLKAKTFFFFATVTFMDAFSTRHMLLLPRPLGVYIVHQVG